jgi:hypothetical protein
METVEKKPATLSQMARSLRVPVGWLRAEADAGRVPCLHAGKARLFDPETVARVLKERAAAGKGAGHAR